MDSAPATVIARDDPEGDRVSLARATLDVLAGRVVWTTGEPAAGVTVEFTATDDVALVQTETTTADGVFRTEVPGFDGALWQVRTGPHQKGGYVGIQGVRAPNESIQLTLPIFGRIGFRVFSQEDGTPLSVARVWSRGLARDLWSPVGIRLDTLDVAWADLPLGRDPVDLLVATDDDEHLRTEILNAVIVDGEVHHVGLERGATAVFRFRSVDGTPGLADDLLIRVHGPNAREDAMVLVNSAEGIARCGPLVAGPHTLVTGEYAAFEPSAIHITHDPQQTFDITWRIVDEAAYELARELDEARKAGLIGPGDIGY